MSLHATGTSFAELLMRRVTEWGVAFNREPSFRLGMGSILSNRFLLSVLIEDLGAAALERVDGFGRELNLPDLALGDVSKRFGWAKFVHFGYEQNLAGDPFLKLYLEAHPPDASNSSRAPYPDFHAIKWSPVEPASPISSVYLRYPNLTNREITDRVLNLYPGDDSLAVDCRDVLTGMLHLVSTRMEDGTIRYLEVQEAGTGRHSYDLNLYDSRLTMRDVQPFLRRMGRIFEVPSDAVSRLLEEIKSKRLGHLSGGIHRDGRPFLNVYYGVERIAGAS